MNQPLVSVVMPSLNQAAFLPAAVASVLGQSYANVELIVADGGSTDGTLAILESLQQSDARLRWLSEPDRGPADALNKALRRVRGTVIGWLNSDDLYTPGAVQRAAQALHDEPEWLMVYGQGEHVDASGGFLGRYPSLPPATHITGFAQGCFICQPTVFFTRTLWLLLGPLDEGLKTAFDFDYWLRAFKQVPGRIGFLDILQARSRLHDDCITQRQRRTVTLEGMQLLARHLGYAPKEWLLTYVNEILSEKPHQRELNDLQMDVCNMVVRVKPWLLTGELDALQHMLKLQLGGARAVES
jgi:glycosyltransferase involved in cell wall biosynthesis